jgi:hypothetical protein
MQLLRGLVLACALSLQLVAAAPQVLYSETYANAICDGPVASTGIHQVSWTCFRGQKNVSVAGVPAYAEYLSFNCPANTLSIGSSSCGNATVPLPGVCFPLSPTTSAVYTCLPTSCTPQYSLERRPCKQRVRRCGNRFMPMKW